MQHPRIITALITPFLPDGSLDLEGLKTNITFQMENRIEGILILGSTGESPTLNREERTEIIKTAVAKANNEVSVVVGTGANSTQGTIELTQEAERLGADMALIVTPYYNCPTQQGIYEHFKAVSKATNIPICVYNIPKRTSRNIETPTLAKIAKLPSVVGVKESSGDLCQVAEIMQEIALVQQDFVLWGGDDPLTLPTMSLGGIGVISVASNLLPNQMSEIVALASEGHFREAKSLFYKLYPILKGLFIETNPIGIKTAMEIYGMPSGPTRLPLTKMLDENRKLLHKVLKESEVLPQTMGAFYG